MSAPLVELFTYAEHKSKRLDTGRKYRFSSLRYDPPGNRTHLHSSGFTLCLQKIDETLMFFADVSGKHKIILWKCFENSK